MKVPAKLKKQILKLNRAGLNRVEIRNRLKIKYSWILAVLPKEKQVTEPIGPPLDGFAERCPHCGAMVILPCLKCYLERLGEPVAPTPSELRKPLPKPLQDFLASLRAVGVVWDEDLVEREREEAAALLTMGLIETIRGPEDETGFVIAGASFRRKGF